MPQKGYGKHIYIAAGACMMLILILVIAAFGRSVFADQDQVKITPDQAKQIALEHAGVTLEQVTINQVKLDTEGRIPVYEIEFYTSERMWDYEINAESGVIREQESIVKAHSGGKSETKSGEAGESRSGAQDVIGVVRAQEIALEAAGYAASEVSFYQTSLETDDGILVYEVKFLVGVRKFDYTIDASGGTILEMEVELSEDEVWKLKQESTSAPETTASRAATAAESAAAGKADRYDDDDDDRDEQDDDRDGDDRYDEDDDDRDDDEDRDDDDDRDDDEDRDDGDDEYDDRDDDDDRDNEDDD